MGRQSIGKRRNLLLRYKQIIEELDKHNCRDVPITIIWRKYIYPKFYISRETLYKAINTDIDAELDELQHQWDKYELAKKQQLKLHF